MDHIRPIGPDPDLDPVLRVTRAQEERERRERERRDEQDRPRPRPQPPAAAADAPPEGPVEGDDGHLHIDIKA